MKIINGLIIHNGQILRDKILYINNGLISDTDNNDSQVIDACGNYVSAGFVDIHVHGGGGADRQSRANA